MLTIVEWKSFCPGSEINLSRDQQLNGAHEVDRCVCERHGQAVFLSYAGHEIKFASRATHAQQDHLASRPAKVESKLTSRRRSARVNYKVKTRVPVTYMIFSLERTYVCGCVGAKLLHHL